MLPNYVKTRHLKEACLIEEAIYLKLPQDINQRAKSIVEIATGEGNITITEDEVNRRRR